MGFGFLVFLVLKVLFASVWLLFVLHTALQAFLYGRFVLHTALQNSPTWKYHILFSILLALTVDLNPCLILFPAFFVVLIIILSSFLCVEILAPKFWLKLQKYLQFSFYKKFLQNYFLTSKSNRHVLFPKAFHN